MMTFTEATKKATQEKTIAHAFKSSTASGTAIAYWCSFRKRVCYEDVEA